MPMPMPMPTRLATLASSWILAAMLAVVPSLQGDQRCSRAT